VSDRLRVLEGGGRQPLLILLHGLGATAEVWEGWRPLLEERWPGRWLAPDLPGHGGSAPLARYSFGSLAAAVADLVGTRSRCSRTEPRSTCSPTSADPGLQPSANQAFEAIMISRDAGRQWSQPIKISNFIGPPGCGPENVCDPDTGEPVRVGTDLPDIAVDRTTGSVYVVWADARFAGGANRVDAVLSRSTDGGRTWSTPLKVNQRRQCRPPRSTRPSRYPGTAPSACSTTTSGKVLGCIGDRPLWTGAVPPRLPAACHPLACVDGRPARRSSPLSSTAFSVALLAEHASQGPLRLVRLVRLVSLPRPPGGQCPVG
jgi:hypothetical protein